MEFRNAAIEWVSMDGGQSGVSSVRIESVGSKDAFKMLELHEVQIQIHAKQIDTLTRKLES